GQSWCHKETGRHAATAGGPFAHHNRWCIRFHFAAPVSKRVCRLSPSQTRPDQWVGAIELEAGALPSLGLAREHQVARSGSGRETGGNPFAHQENARRRRGGSTLGAAAELSATTEVQQSASDRRVRHESAKLP